ncbi:hypothetical protein KAR91_18110 [Candidatus Pacearchaeota archaeon]|nr:hypothetical protein [Candidatus Pacearchaeota archaeon]
MEISDQDVSTIINALAAADCQMPYNSSLDNMAHAAVDQALVIFGNKQKEEKSNG